VVMKIRRGVGELGSGLTRLVRPREEIARQARTSIIDVDQKLMFFRVRQDASTKSERSQEDPQAENEVTVAKSVNNKV
jgi:hypothetical protein